VVSSLYLWGDVGCAAQIEIEKAMTELTPEHRALIDAAKEAMS